MKRLRYLIWALFACITDELQPSPCDSRNPTAHPDCVGSNCSCQWCFWPEGHRCQHENNLTGVKWD